MYKSTSLVLLMCNSGLQSKGGQRHETAEAVCAVRLYTFVATPVERSNGTRTGLFVFVEAPPEDATVCVQKSSFPVPEVERPPDDDDEENRTTGQRQ